MVKPLITKEYTGVAGVTYILEYFECDSFEVLPQSDIKQCYAVAFNGDNMVIVHNGKKDTWGLVGGSVEEGETLGETLSREIKEESIMYGVQCTLYMSVKIVFQKSMEHVAIVYLNYKNLSFMLTETLFYRRNVFLNSNTRTF